MPRPTEILQAALLMIRRHGIGAAAIWIEIITEINRIRAEERSAYAALPLEAPPAGREIDDRIA